MALDSSGCPQDLGIDKNYAQTKVGNVFFAKHLARKSPESGIVHVAVNPGNLRTNLQRHWTGIAPKIGVCPQNLRDEWTSTVLIIGR